MRDRSQKSTGKIKVIFRLLWPLSATFFAFSMLIFPGEVFRASLLGLNAWWNVVLPALLPFLVVSELLIGYGVLDLLGVLLEPVMRPLFNLPGCGAFVVAIGYTSGPPVSAVVTARLRQQGLCTRLEGERLISFTTNSSPLFMFGAVAVGMLHNPKVGIIIAGAHYLANLLLGLLLRFYGRKDPERTAWETASKGNLFHRAFQAMVSAQLRDTRAFGKILGDAIRNSFQTLTIIGGFIILFSMIIQVMDLTGLISLLSVPVSSLVSVFGFSPDLVKAVTGGMVEMTIGSKLVSETASSLEHQVVAVSLILGWMGLCVLGQVAAMIAETDLRLRAFILTRAVQGLIAAILSILLFKTVQPVFSLTGSSIPAEAFSFQWWMWPLAAGLLPIALLFAGLMIAFIDTLLHVRPIIFRR